MSLTDQQWQELEEDVYDMDGQLVSLYELTQWLSSMRPKLNELWDEEHNLLWVGIGFNEGDDMLTLSVDIR